MTRAANTVRVPLTAGGALAVARWLHTYPFLDKPSAAWQENTLLLTGRLRAAARHSRTHLELPRQLAEHASMMADGYIVWISLAGALKWVLGDAADGVAFGRYCADALLRRRGRPRRTASQTVERVQRLASYKYSDPRREIRRLRRRVRLDEWSAAVRDRGETLLTSSAPPPE